MAYSINETCIGCTACTNVCPVDCISGSRKEQHDINPQVCIDCGACGRVCPVDAIEDTYGVVTERKKRNTWPKPVVYMDSCTGCQYCVDICPVDCLDLVESDEVPGFNPVAKLMNEKICIGCFLCEDVCLKGAIEVLTPEEQEIRGVVA